MPDIKIIGRPFPFIEDSSSRSLESREDSNTPGVICGRPDDLNYELDIAKKDIENYPQLERDGRVVVRIGDKEFPKDWILKHAAFMKTRGEV